MTVSMALPRCIRCTPSEYLTYIPPMWYNVSPLNGPKKYLGSPFRSQLTYGDAFARRTDTYLSKRIGRASPLSYIRKRLLGRGEDPCEHTFLVVAVSGVCGVTGWVFHAAVQWLSEYRNRPGGISVFRGNMELHRGGSRSHSVAPQQRLPLSLGLSWDNLCPWAYYLACFAPPSRSWVMYLLTNAHLSVKIHIWIDSGPYEHHKW